MNIFEKLIDELKEENLLEETVMENNGSSNNENNKTLKFEEPEDSIEESVLFEESEEEIEELASDVGDSDFPDLDVEDSDLINEVELNAKIELSDSLEETGFEFKPATEESTDVINNGELSQTTEEPEMKIPDSAEFFFRRAKEEVASLQMVEHILSGVERDQMKIISKTFDDLAVKSALHKFGNAVSADSAEQSKAEFQLMQETENWYSALSQRDKNITVGNLRRFCETTRPVLSSQALLGLARFYRNAPYSEAVRSKFDLIITRLLTRENGDDRRELVFGRDEIVKHLEGLYAEWSSISLYSPEKDDSTTLIAALKLEDFITEANEAEYFDDLIKKDFFNRLRTVKESTSENFFAPVVTTAAIECNVRIGNRYIELLRAEEVNPEILIEKYGILREEAISDITGKTLQLAQLLKKKDEIVLAEKQDKKKNNDQKVQNNSEKIKTKPVTTKKTNAEKKSPLKINKWLLAVAIAVILGNVILFFAASDSVSGGQGPTVVADKVNLENSVLKEHLKSARLSNGVFFGRVASSWNTLTQEQKEQFLQKILIAGKERGFSTIHLLDDQSRPIAFANSEKVQVNEIKPGQ